eukprot:TRINITY_DN3733_c1_g2_i2.p1 TRINITY_DN3733_c1_g2~~TRINITY_DN3733_c1_g2_i2.p1  ORF type:complete len:219 (+),score=44.52 TRINITY_DN3733_c1_g2_i2:29-685(+)
MSIERITLDTTKKTQIFPSQLKSNGPKKSRNVVRIIDGIQLAMGFYGQRIIFSLVGSHDFFEVNPGVDLAGYELRNADIGCGIAFAFYYSKSQGNLLVLFSYKTLQVRVEEVEGCEFALMKNGVKSSMVVCAGSEKLVVLNDLYGSNEFREDIELAEYISQPNAQLSKLISQDEILLVGGVQRWAIVNLHDGFSYFVLTIRNYHCTGKQYCGILSFVC